MSVVLFPMWEKQHQVNTGGTRRISIQDLPARPTKLHSLSVRTCADINARWSCQGGIDMKIAITGHRPNKLDKDYGLTGPWMAAIRSALQDVINEKKPTIMISGMALGIDTMWAELAIANKIPLIAALPCLGQGSHWPQSSRDRYNNILLKAYSTHICSFDTYTPQCMQKRNEWMVDNCDLLVAVWNGTPGGTANCINYASSPAVNKPILHINPDQLRPTMPLF